MKIYKILHIPTGLYVMGYPNIHRYSLEETGSYFNNLMEETYEDIVSTVVHSINAFHLTTTPIQAAEFIDIQLTFDKDEFRFL